MLRRLGRTENVSGWALASPAAILIGVFGLLPVLIHGRAHEICIIGLGSAVTLGSALSAGVVEQADVVEYLKSL